MKVCVCSLNQSIYSSTWYIDIFHKHFLQTKEGGDPINRIQAFRRAHTKKNGEPINQEATEIFVSIFLLIILDVFS